MYDVFARFNRGITGAFDAIATMPGTLGTEAFALTGAISAKNCAATSLLLSFNDFIPGISSVDNLLMWSFRTRTDFYFDNISSLFDFCLFWIKELLSTNYDEKSILTDFFKE